MPAGPSDFDPLLALRTLVDHDVRFILIGGYAAQLRGSSAATFDTDVCYARGDENHERLAAALKQLNARLRGEPPDAPFQLDAKTIARGDHFTFLTDAGSLDCMATPSGIPQGFDELDRAADDFPLGDLTVRVASIDDLIRMKRAAGRPKDLIAVEELGALRDEIDAQAMEARKRRRRT